MNIKQASIIPENELEPYQKIGNTPLPPPSCIDLNFDRSHPFQAYVYCTIFQSKYYVFIQYNIQLAYLWILNAHMVLETKQNYENKSIQMKHEERKSQIIV